MGDQVPYYYRAELCGRRGKNGKVRDAVVDGDTVDVLCDLGYDVRIALRLRLMGIDTPESRTRRLEEKAMGLAAKEFLKNILECSGGIEFLSHEKGKYGRVLATLFVLGDDGRVNVNELLVREGHARLYAGGAREPWVV